MARTDAPATPTNLADAITALHRRGAAERRRILKTARLQRRLNTGLIVAGIVLAAAAGFTVLPESISRFVGASLALSAAVVTGLTTAFNPAREARRKLLLANEWARWMDDVESFARLQMLMAEEERENRFQDLLDRRDALRNAEHEARGPEPDRES